jgi:putative membrane protein
MMMGFGVLGMFLMLLFWGVLIVGAVFLVRALFPKGEKSISRSLSENGNDPRNILDQRYARGEITREEYEMIKQDIVG